MEQPSVKKNYLYRLLYEILTLLTPFITTPYVSRVLGADGIGIYSYVNSVVTYFMLFASLGTLTYGAREIAQHRDEPRVASILFWEIEIMTIGTSMVCLFVWFFVILFGGNYMYYYIALIPMLLATMFDISWFFTGYEKVKYIVVRNILCKSLGIVLLFALVHDKNDLMIYIILNSLLQFLGNLSMWTYLPGMLVKIDFRQLTFQKHLRETLVYFIPTIATSVYTVLDKTLIGAITKDTYQNGYYEQATKVIKIVKTVVFVSINSVMGARISYLFASERFDEIHHKISRSMDYIFLLGFGCVFGLIGVSKNFIPLFLGSGYEPVTQLLYLMSPLVLIIGISNCLGCQYYTPGGRRKQSARYIVIGSTANLVFNLLLIPEFGAAGATIASVVAELSITLMYVSFSNGYMTFVKLWHLAWKRLVAGIIMLQTVFFVDRFSNFEDLTALLIQIIAGIFIYGITLLILHDQMMSEFFKTGKRKMEDRFSS